jgi:putative protease
MNDKKIGEVTHFFDKISVGIVKLDEELKIGDKVRFQGATTNFDQDITEMQLDHENIEKANKGQEIGIRTNDKVRIGDDVYLLG